MKLYQTGNSFRAYFHKNSAITVNMKMNEKQSSDLANADFNLKSSFAVFDKSIKIKA